MALKLLVLAPFSEWVVLFLHVSGNLLTSVVLQALQPQMVLPHQHNHLWSGFLVPSVPSKLAVLLVGRFNCGAAGTVGNTLVDRDVLLLF